MDPIAAFHGHLDVCAHCRAHPFALCLVGLELLRTVAHHRTAEAAAPPPPTFTGWPRAGVEHLGVICEDPLCVPCRAIRDPRKAEA